MSLHEVWKLFGMTVVFGVALVLWIIFLVWWLPNPKPAIVLRICEGMPVYRQDDGSIWLRYRSRTYLVEDINKLCGER